MNLIYSSNQATARIFALSQELAPGDWKWIKDGRVISEYPRADIYKLQHWDANPRHVDIDAALERARQKRRLGTLIDYS
ncbi:hypothetical protein [Cognatiluteimonas profundi]|uniref:hypothetical protein n=1 Tax=Cognatiluteimonas profundi TaxID=2594501 RepID=UPI00131A9853|nr:hypothetical protein [Lysobacter profundi]